MTWIDTPKPAEATGKLAKLYRRVMSADGHVDHIMLAHGLRPASLEGHMTLYKAVLHHRELSLPAWLREAIGTYVSMLNRCDYCVEHHFAGMQQLLADPPRAERIRQALSAARPQDAFNQREAKLLEYAALLTRTPAEVNQGHIAELRALDWSDAEILELNQIAAYFAYANRTVLGLGVAIDNEPLGLAPRTADEGDDWSHQ
jgi:uncharacterized peroxidase-related enzyme